MTVTRSQTVDIGGGRGRLAPAAAASLRRVDRHLGRLTDVNSAWRDPALQQQLRDAYLRYLNGGPWAPIALDPDDSVHCDGEAIDTDDGYDARTHAILNEHGWRLTVYRWVNGVRKLVEPWHREYFPDRDQHRNDPAPTGGKTPTTPEEEEDDMYKPTVHARIDNGEQTEWMLGHPDIGADLPRFTGSGTTSNSRKDGKATVYRGFMVTADHDTFQAWARTYARGTGQITSVTNRGDYIDIQIELSRIATELK